MNNACICGAPIEANRQSCGECPGSTKPQFETLVIFPTGRECWYNDEAIDEAELEGNARKLVCTANSFIWEERIRNGQPKRVLVVRFQQRPTEGR